MNDDLVERNILEIIDSLNQGVDILTGEIFEKSVLSTNKEISDAIILLALSTQANLKLKNKDDSLNALNRPANKIFEDLKHWRKEQAAIIGCPAYCVFNDNVLWSIAQGDVERKEDLLFIKGINKTKYDMYGEDLYSILSEYIGTTLQNSQSMENNNYLSSNYLKSCNLKSNQTKSEIKVDVGTNVKIKFSPDGDIFDCHIFRLNREEVPRTGSQYNQFQKPEILVTNPENFEETGKLAIESSLGKALFGKMKGDIVRYKTPTGINAEVKILNITLSNN